MQIDDAMSHVPIIFEPYKYNMYGRMEWDRYNTRYILAILVRIIYLY
jgi:hypothetical protein